MGRRKQNRVGIRTKKVEPRAKTIMISGEGFKQDQSQNFTNAVSIDVNEVCPMCERKVEENENAVACDGICQRWHHIACAELQQGQFNA